MEGVQANVTNLAVIDSYISDIHDSTTDSQAIVAYLSPGPIKIVNNYPIGHHRRRDVRWCWKR